VVLVSDIVVLVSDVVVLESDASAVVATKMNSFVVINERK
jgi:hypothetical protein